MSQAPKPDLQTLAEEILTDLMARFPLRHRPELLWKGLRVSAGMAYYRINRIGLSRYLLTDEDRLRSTLIHEYAHLLAYERHGQKAAGHGPLWKKAMLDLGAKPERTHCYQVERNTARQVVIYQCKRCGANIQRSRRLPLRRKYVHAQCGGGLKLVSVERQATD